MESIKGHRMQEEEGRQRVRRRGGIAQQKVKGDVRIAQGKHRQEACIAGYVRRELIK